jgi:hypothetical protein
MAYCNKINHNFTLNIFEFISSKYNIIGKHQKRTVKGIKKYFISNSSDNNSMLIKHDSRNKLHYILAYINICDMIDNVKNRYHNNNKLH